MAQRPLEIGSIAEALLHRTPFRLESETATLAGTYTLTVNSSPLQVLDGAGARDIFVPDAEDMPGGVFLIVNIGSTATENFTVKSGTAASSTTICTIVSSQTAASAEAGLVFNDGENWYGLVAARA